MRTQATFNQEFYVEELVGLYQSSEGIMYYVVALAKEVEVLAATEIIYLEAIGVVILPSIQTEFPEKVEQLKAVEVDEKLPKLEK